MIIKIKLIKFWEIDKIEKKLISSTQENFPESGKK